MLLVIPLGMLLLGLRRRLGAAFRLRRGGGRGDRPLPASRTRGTRRAIRPLVLLLAAGVATPRCVRAHDPGRPEADPFEEGWRWSELGREVGLPEGLIDELVESADRIMWARIGRSLVYFDGYMWRQAPAPPGPLAGIAPATSGGLLVAAADGAYRVTERLAVRIHPHLPPPILAVASAGDTDLALLPGPRLVPLGKGVSPDLELPDGISEGLRVPPLFQSGGHLWLHGRKSLSEWSPRGGWTRRAPLKVSLLAQDGDGALVTLGDMRDHHGLWSLGPGEPQPLFVGEGTVVALDTAPDRTAVAVFDTGVVRVRRADRWRELRGVPVPLGSAQMLRFQSSGDLWVAVASSLYLHNASSRRWRHDAEVGPQVNALLARRDGSLWAGTSAGLHIRHADGRLERLTNLLDVRAPVITGLAEDGAGQVWVTSGQSFSGALRYRDGSWRRVGAGDGLDAERVHAVAIDRSGRPWFLGIADWLAGPPISLQPGAFVLDNDTFRRVGQPEGLLDGRVYSFLETSDGALWFGTVTGLSRLHDREWSYWKRGPDGLRGDKVFTLAESQDGRVWFGHQYDGGGLGFLERDGSLGYLTKGDGLPSDRVWSVIPARPDGVWVGTDRGVVHVEGDRVAVLGRATGLRHEHVWPLLETGHELLMGTLGGGVYALNLEETARARPPRIRILEPATRAGHIELEWVTLAYRGEIPSSRVQARYRVDSEPWSGHNPREITLHGLDPGVHVLTVEATALPGASAQATRTFLVPVPFHRQPLFLASLGVLMLSASLVAATTLRRRRARHRELLRREARFRALIENASDSITVVDRQGLVRFQSPASRHISGHTPEELLDTRILDLVVPEDRERAQEFLRNPRPGAELFRFRHRDGSQRVVEVVGHPLPDDPAGSLVLNARDATQRARLDAERAELEASRRRHERLESLGLMAGGVAHDFNNLLAVIVGHADLAQAALDPRARPFHDLAQIQLAARRAAELTASLLAYTGRRPPRLTTLDAGEVVRETAAILNVSLPRGVRLLCETWPEPLPIDADRAQVQQVVLNLLTNAVEAAGPGSMVTARTSRGPFRKCPGRVIASPEPDTDVALITVSDQGHGMDGATAERMFDPFFTTKFTGRGLGLSAVLGTVRTHGGGIAVETAPGAGTTITVGLPLSRKPLAAVESPAAEAPRIGPVRILLVDDDVAVREVVAEILAREGYRVLAAASGIEARLVMAGHPDIEAAILDLAMPDENGLQLMAELRRLRPQLPVLLITGLSAEAGAEALGDDPRAAALQKPFHSTELVGKLRQLLAGGTGAASPR